MNHISSKAIEKSKKRNEMPKESPQLFGLEKTNRDFSKKESWGKNQFNSSFPAFLCCYLASKNDKAFASAGNVTNSYMSTPRLENPIISKTEIKNIILGGGQNLLSTERRFDAIIFNSPELFK